MKEKNEGKLFRATQRNKFVRILPSSISDYAIDPLLKRS